MSSWQWHVNKGRRHFNQNEFSSALEAYKEASRIAEDHAPRFERSTILSNIVACRLKIGDTENLSIAVDEAKECISLNNRSSKGYVRLASVYLALGGHSNDACQALQSAITIDPSNSLARSLLAKELRRDNVHSRADSNGNGRDDLGTEFVELDGESYTIDNDGSPSAPPIPGEEDTGSRNVNGNGGRGRNGGETWTQTIYHKCLNAYNWYQESSDNTKTCVRVIIVFLVLYAAFALDSLSRSGESNRYGNYSGNNAYDQFRYNEERLSRGHGYGHHDRHHNYDHHGSSSRSRRHRSRSYGGYNNDWDFSYSYIVILVVIFALHSLGVPIQAIAPLGFGMRRRHGFGFGNMNMGMGRGGYRVHYGPMRAPVNGGMFGRRRW